MGGSGLIVRLQTMFVLLRRNLWCSHNSFTSVHSTADIRGPKKQEQDVPLGDLHGKHSGDVSVRCRGAAGVEPILKVLHAHIGLLRFIVFISINRSCNFWSPFAMFDHLPVACFTQFQLALLQTASV